MAIVAPAANTTLSSELARDRTIDGQAYLIALAILAGFAIVDSLSILTEHARAGRVVDPLTPWIFEVSSAVMIAALFPALAWFSRRVPLTLENWLVATPVYAAVSIAYSAVHVSGMVAIRKIVFYFLYDRPYTFFEGDAGSLLRESVYEYRKDVLGFVLFLGILHLWRHLAQYKREAAAARADAQKTRRLTLKCGGRTIYLDAASIDYAKAAGNYVEISANDATHLARISLGALEAQLAEAGTRAARVHRSYVVNRDKIAEIAPSGDGDVKITLANGAELPGSRRYRDRLDPESRQAAPVR